MSTLLLFLCDWWTVLILDLAREEMAPMQQSSNRRQSVGQLVETLPWAVLLQRTSNRT